MKLARVDMNDTQRFYSDVKAGGAEGRHSHDLADSIPSLNVSQRAKDCTTKGQQVYTRSERRNGRAGARFWLEGFQPEDAVAVRPNGVEGGDGGEAVVSLDPDVESNDRSPEGGRTGPAERAQIASGVAARPSAYGWNRSVRRGSNDSSDREPESSRGSVVALSAADLCWHADYTLPNGPPRTEDGWYPVGRRRAA